jgi:NTP pyrophosphatase (non-canonical NTP hydrolase)
MLKFSAKESLSQLQSFIEEIYGLPDDRLFSLPDLLSNQERFTMRALKGIRKGNKERLKSNLLIAFSWLLAAANRLGIDAEEATWRRFPTVCSYCGKQPCICKKTRPLKRKKNAIKKSLRPKSLSGFQKMFSLIYPPSSRNLNHAGIHLAEEMGELSEAVYSFLGEHKNQQFKKIENEVADFISCIFGVANSAKIDMAKELARIYCRNCHVCHKNPCECNFSFVARFKS